MLSLTSLENVRGIYRFNIDIAKEDWEEFKEIEIKKWQDKVLKYFGEGSKIQPRDIEKKDYSATNVGNNTDFLVTNLWPLLGKNDLLNRSSGSVKGLC